MFHKRSNWVLAAIALLTFCVPAAFAAKADNHQHQSGKHDGHGNSTSGHSHDQHDGHQCEHMVAVDANKDGKISKDEFMKHHEQMFDKKDINKDGFIDKEEMHRMMEKMHQHMQEHKHEHEHGDHQTNKGHAHGDTKK